MARFFWLPQLAVPAGAGGCLSAPCIAGADGGSVIPTSVNLCLTK